MKYCVCKINTEEGNTGTGFFCRIPFPDKDNLIHVLITNNHVLNEKDITNGKVIQITINDRENKNLIINEEKKTFTDPDLDITFLEIKPVIDDIIYFLDIDDDIANNNISLNSYKKKSLYCLHYPRGNKINVSYGLSSSIVGNDIK